MKPSSRVWLTVRKSHLNSDCTHRSHPGVDLNEDAPRFKTLRPVLDILISLLGVHQAEVQIWDWAENSRTRD